MARSLLQTPAQQRIQAIKKGLSYKDFEKLAKDLEIPSSDLAQIIGVSTRTLQRRKQDGHLMTDESDRLFRIVRLLDCIVAE
jgi:putative toxin-antitoxin system antitoxin component (TIGR02293 family)